MSQTAPVVELLLDARAALGEGPFWDERRQVLYWVDIDGYAVHLFDPATGRDRVIDVGRHVGTVVPREPGGGSEAPWQLVLALRDGFGVLDVQTGRLEMLGDPEADRPGNRFNDGKCDPAGRFWAGTMEIAPRGGVRGHAGALYRLDADGSIHRMIEGVGVSNGIVWSLDGRIMYYIDTPTQEVAAWDYDPATGAIANRRVAIRIAPEIGKPDGMTIDAEGKLWIAMWDGWKVTRWDPAPGGSAPGGPAGRLLESIAVPAARVSACAFGGADLSDLYLTTARGGLSEAALAAQPHAGGLFRVRPGVRGVALPGYAG